MNGSKRSRMSVAEGEIAVEMVFLHQDSEDRDKSRTGCARSVG